MNDNLFLSLGLAAMFTACAPAEPYEPVTTRNDVLVHGNVQRTLHIGETTQTDVLETFGAPNIATVDGSGLEVWTYQRSATVEQESSGGDYWWLLVTGGSGGSSGYEQTQRTMTLIIKFDEFDVVRDFRSRSSEF